MPAPAPPATNRGTRREGTVCALTNKARLRADAPWPKTYNGATLKSGMPEAYRVAFPDLTSCGYGNASVAWSWTGSPRVNRGTVSDRSESMVETYRPAEPDDTPWPAAYRFVEPSVGTFSASSGL